MGVRRRCGINNDTFEDNLMSQLEDTLYKVISECLNMLIEDFDVGDIDMPEFCAKVERLFGDTPISSIGPVMGLEWELTPTGYNFYYVAAGHTATLRASATEDGKFVHGVIKYTDVESEEPPEARSFGCGDKACTNCNPPLDIKFFPPGGLLVSFGPLSGEIN